MAFNKTLVVEAGAEVAPYGDCAWCNEDPAIGLWQGRIWTRDDQRLMPYKAFLCEQCRNNFAENTGDAGRWLRRYRVNSANVEVWPKARYSEKQARKIWLALYPPQEG